MIGSFGKIVFSVSDKKIVTFNNFNRKSSKRTATLEVIKGKPRTEYLGADLSKITFDIRLDASYGVKPKDMLKELEKMVEGKKCYPLIIGGSPVGANDWSLDSISESWDIVYSKGEVAAATVNISLTEYVSTM